MAAAGRFKSSTSGKLVVRAIEAKGTLAMDIGGTSDPYCVMKLNGVERKTKVCWRKLDPVWNEEFVFEVQTADDKLQVEIWDKDKLAKDDFMGNLEIYVAPFTEKAASGWFPIGDTRTEKQSVKDAKKERGKIHLQFSFWRYSLVSRAMLHDHGHMLAQIAMQLPKPDQRIADAFVGLCEDDPASLVNYMTPLFADEVARTNDTATLFRGDSMATKSLKSASKQLGQGWLHQVLAPMVRHILETSTQDLPNVEENPEAALPKLQQDCNRFLYQILGSMAYAPVGMRMLARALSDSVEKRFPDQKIQAVGNFVFLRFFCPALSVPEAYGLCSADAPAEAKRYLLTIAKVLQVLANDARFGTKEAALSDLNQSFLERNRPPFLKAFTDWICGMLSGGGSFPPPELPYADLLARYEFIIAYFKQHLNTLKSLYSLGPTETVASIEQTIDNFSVIAAQQRLQQLDWDSKHA